ncbi:hypothetical protein DFS33DRAFT_1276741 [Desarmillaria ectypa]|nr:hypothetical protein DFS33DRAFT_1276741 [Desarmillaria ectypa]
MDRQKKNPYECEDSCCTLRASVYMDAKDTSTRQIVAMKRTKHKNNPNELAIAAFPTSEEKPLDRRNHYVPILRILPIPDEEGFKTVDWTKRTPKHDPFAVDIYYLGSAFRAFLRRGVEADYKLGEKGLHGMRGSQFMEPLIAAMTEPDPSKRIKIDEAVRKFALVEKGLSAIALRSRVAYNTDFTIFRPFKAFGHWVWTLGLIAQRTHAIPNPLS